MSHHPWGQTVEIFGIESPTNGHCCEEHTICLVLYPMTGTKGMNGIVLGSSCDDGNNKQEGVVIVLLLVE